MLYQLGVDHNPQWGCEHRRRGFLLVQGVEIHYDSVQCEVR